MGESGAFLGKTINSDMQAKNTSNYRHFPASGRTQPVETRDPETVKTFLEIVIELA